MRIQHNISALNSYRNYTNNTNAVAKNLEKLSSGYRINRAGDDAAGLAISEKMRAQITGLETAQKNAQDGISLVQTAEGALTEVHSMLNRMVELADQSANGTYDNAVDRANLQKEVKDLQTEINRIADATNFNGLNLLDGTLGLNTDAFTISGADAIAASDGTIDVSSLVAKDSAHLEGAASAAATPKATIDLGDLEVDVAANETATLTFTFGAKDYTVDLAGGAAGKKFTTDEIAAELAKSLNKDINSADGTTGTPNAMNIGGAAFTAAANGSEITLTYAGSEAGAGGAWKAETTFSGDQTLADTINKALGFDVKLKSVVDGVHTGGEVHMTTKVEQAKAEVVAGKAGIDLNLTADMLVQGGELTIDGYTFVFQTEKDAPATPANGKILDIQGKTAAEVANLLSNETVTGQDGREWKIGVNQDGTLHIEQTKESDPGKEIKTYDDLVGLISAKGEVVTAANAGTSIKITDAEVKEGNGLTIDGKKYEFTDDADKLASTGGDVTYVAIKGGAAKNLADKLGNAAQFDADTNTITLRAANEGDKAPTVLGKGLTLQIGDTSDSFNQLNVSIVACKTADLGIADIDIGTQEGAAAAVDKIKNAINYVSDVRGTLGATQNRLEHTINNLSVTTENMTAAESRIRDVDVAKEMMAYTKNNILVQSAQAMLAQANQVPQGVLQLLQ